MSDDNFIVPNANHNTIALWNINGWTAWNSELKKRILLDLNPDLISINQTHLKGSDVIYLPAYTWLGQNQKTRIKAVKGSGGVGLD